MFRPSSGLCDLVFDWLCLVSLVRGCLRNHFCHKPYSTLTGTLQHWQLRQVEPSDLESHLQLSTFPVTSNLVLQVLVYILPRPWQPAAVRKATPADMTMLQAICDLSECIYSPETCLFPRLLLLIKHSRILLTITQDGDNPTGDEGSRSREHSLVQGRSFKLRMVERYKQYLHVIGCWSPQALLLGLRSHSVIRHQRL